MNGCGCAPNDSTLLVGPQGLPGSNGLNAVCTNGTNAKSRIDTSFGTGLTLQASPTIPPTNPNLISSPLSTWNSLAYIIFPGTNNLPTAISHIYIVASFAGSGFIKLISPAGNITAGTTLYSNGSPQLIDLGTISSSNFSTTVQVLTLQGFLNSGSLVVYSLSLLGI